MSEQWRDVVGYEGYYQVSDLGHVRSLDRVVRGPRGEQRVLKGRILRPSSLNHYGHLKVNLHKKGVRQTNRVHQLVATAFIGPCPEGQQVRHGSNGVTDNSVSNLCYGTSSEDALDRRRDGTHGGRAVRRSDGVEFINMHIAAEETSCWAGHICKVCNGKYKTAGGFSWAYI